MATLKVETVQLHVPAHEELVKVIEQGISENFASFSVSYEECPDLTAKPYHLKSKGISGRPSILDVGGVKYLIPLANQSKIYNVDVVAEAVGYTDGYLIGAGAGGGHIVGVNCELMANVKLGSEGEIGSYTAEVNREDGTCVLKEYHHKDFCFLGNFLVSEGKAGKVLRIKASKRTGSKDFVSSIREAIASHYKDKPVGLGGVFVIGKGKAHLHVMPALSSTPLATQDDVDKWLKFYDMSSPLTCLSVLVSHDPDLDLRVEHTHCFSDHGEGGHYHFDTTPDDVEYEAFYTIAEQLHRVDRPNS